MTRTLYLFAVVGLGLTSVPVRAADPGIVSSEFIFEKAPFPSCHASTLVETKSGLVAAWFGGKYEKHPSVGIWSSRQLQGKWTDPVEVATGEEPGKDRL